MSRIVRAEREALCALLAASGPKAPTLCGDWTTADLAAHLAARERRPDTLPGLMLPLLAGHTERVRRGYLAMDYERLVHLLERPAWWAPTTVVESFDLTEWFIHHEDVRRAVPDWKPRRLSRAVGEALWAKIYLVTALLRRTGYAVTLSAPGYGRRSVGSGPVTATVTGRPGELLLFCSGRQSHARVEVEGRNAAKLRAAKLGI